LLERLEEALGAVGGGGGGGTTTTTTLMELALDHYFFELWASIITSEW